MALPDLEQFDFARPRLIRRLRRRHAVVVRLAPVLVCLHLLLLASLWAAGMASIFVIHHPIRGLAAVGLFALTLQATPWVGEFARYPEWLEREIRGLEAEHRALTGKEP